MITIKKDGRILVGATDSVFDWPFQVISEEGEIVMCIDRQGYSYTSNSWQTMYILTEQSEADINPRVIVEG